MTDLLASVLADLPGARRFGSRYRASCPSCHGRSDKLSIAEGRNGAVLVKCFAGCTLEQICSALGRPVGSLMPSSPAWRDHERQRAERITTLRRRFRELLGRAPDMYAPGADRARRFVLAVLRKGIEHARRERLRDVPGDQPAVRRVDCLRATASVERVFGIVLGYTFDRGFEWEGWGEFDRDPLWPLLFERACVEIAYERHHRTYPRAQAFARGTIDAAVRRAAAVRAHRWLRAEARVALGVAA